jgi:metal-responsive CopG/Arc/MetJ family transcriptional regulator
VTRRKSGTSERIAVTIRVPAELLARVDQACDARQVPMSRNNWILEAVVEKLERKEGRGGSGAD